MDVERRHYLVYGRVQGVGFRYRAAYAAQALGLTGWAANRDDGTVEMEAQGSPEALNKLLPTITRTSQWIEVEDVTIRPAALDPTERGFRVLGY